MIPANLYKVELTGKWEDASGPVGIKLFEWALTWHVESTEVTDDETRLRLMAVTWREYFLQTTQPSSFLASGTVCERARCIRMASERFGESVSDVRPQNPAPLRVLPAQVALLVIGRTQSLGRQTRKWLPCLTFGHMEFNRPVWNLLPGPGSLNEWATGMLLPKPVAFETMTPVVWDEQDEIARPITGILIARTPRTIRRRSLRGTPGPMVTWP